MCTLLNSFIIFRYGSDGGAAASLAKRFAAEAKQRGITLSLQMRNFIC